MKSPDQIFIVIQEGGSSIEAYASSYSRERDATNAMRGHTKASYRSAGPFAVKCREIEGKTYIEEQDMLALLDEIVPPQYEYYE
jgi:hypothetical protein